VHQADDPLQELLELELAGVQLDPPRLDLGHIQHIVDQRQQVAAAVVDRVQAIALAGAEFAEQLGRQGCHPEFAGAVFGDRQDQGYAPVADLVRGELPRLWVEAIQDLGGGQPDLSILVGIHGRDTERGAVGCVAGHFAALGVEQVQAVGAVDPQALRILVDAGDVGRLRRRGERFILLNPVGADLAGGMVEPLQPGPAAQPDVPALVGIQAAIEALHIRFSSGSDSR
jgi:hypothetical protein